MFLWWFGFSWRKFSLPLKKKSHDQIQRSFYDSVFNKIHYNKIILDKNKNKAVTMDPKQFKTLSHKRLFKPIKCSVFFVIFLVLCLLSVIQSVDASTEKFASISIKNILRRQNVTDAKDANDAQNVDSRKTFVSLTAECYSNENSSFVLHLHTSEPFNGWFYSRDHQVWQH